MPVFSIVVPTYNRAERISAAIDSVLNQTFPDFELIIVDDGSTDNTKETVHRYEDPRIVYLYQENKERSAARNNGIRKARGQFVCFLDSDDIYLPNHLSVLHSYILQQKDTKAMFCTGLLRMNKDGIVVGHPANWEGKMHPVRFIWKYFVLPDAVCIHRQILDSFTFDERFRVWEDTHLWLRIASRFPVYQVPVFTAMQKIHSGSTVKAMFSDLNVTEINQYINAIEDLFTHYGDLLAPYLSQKDKTEYISRKCSMFRNRAIRNRRYKVAYKLNRIEYRHTKKVGSFLFKLATTSFRYLLRR